MLGKFIKGWSLPLNFLILLSKVRKKFATNRTTPEIIKFKDIHKGKRCFILATGPSINQMDLTVLKDEISIAVSFFGYHKDIDKISPKYHFCAPNHEPLGEANALNYFHMFREHYSPELVVFLGITRYKYSFDKVLKRYPELTPPNNYMIDYYKSVLIDDDNKNDSEIWDPLQCPMDMMTVAFGAIMLAAYMGCNEIYLLGCDYNYMRDLTGAKNQHFYPDSKTIQGRENISEKGLESFFESSYWLWKRYRLVSEALRKRGVNIYNSSPDSSLDMFPKVSFESLQFK